MPFRQEGQGFPFHFVLISPLLERYDEILAKLLKFNILKLVFPFSVVNVLPHAIVSIGGSSIYRNCFFPIP